MEKNAPILSATRTAHTIFFYDQRHSFQGDFRDINDAYTQGRSRIV